MRNRYISIILLLSIAVLIFSCKKDKAEWQGTIEEVDGVTYVNNPKEGLWDSEEESQITLIEDLKIGEMDGPEEILFVYLRDVAVNSKGDIYVADLKLNEIRKFNKDGEYLMTLGRPGQGPGEFQFLRILSVTSEDDLIVFDGICRVSIFTDSGELLTTTKKLVPDSWIDASKIFATAGKYVIFGKLTNSLKLFHEFDKNWDLTDSYIEYVFIDNKEFEEQTLVFQPGYCVFLNNGEIIYTNFLYNNQIFIYRNRELTTIISKESDINKPYVVEYFNDMEKTKKAAKDKGYYFNQFGPGGYFTGNYIQRSLGVYQLSDGNIINFLNIRKSKEIYEYGVELYDSSGKFLTYSKLGENLGYDIRFKDSNDLFYAIDRREYHKVIRFRLEY